MSAATSAADAVRPLIRTIPDFPKPGIQFRDITTLLADAYGLRAATHGLAELAACHPCDVIAGIEARGFIFGSALAVEVGCGFVPLRKPGKLPVDTIGEDYQLEYGEARLELDPTLIVDGARVLLVDDLLATGGTAVAGARLLRRAGAVVEQALFVIDLPDLPGRGALSAEGVEAHALIAFEGH
ncbi:adenine phosphoribosyltransferase [Aurantiacibacter aquimixticola]|uniref:Adenine phosphoribosyltransferase n=1 Tax=Aurantiacibacter aquimixticola TaxID=1958945 RepID=A0A419RV32_9SPHN|nr:adenine phosphoribosyltransferase [Aurantiacibacter aquimixticola]RJY09646.1 adenine phosphoribosyltransferase [Aurantiacibacter aquimixticola]